MSRVALKQALVDLGGFDALVRARRSVREFSGERVEAETMQALFEAARWAPSSMNLQPYEIHWARSDGAREAMRAACLNQRAAASAGELVAFVARLDRWRAVAQAHHEWLTREPGMPPEAIAHHAAMMKKMPLALALGPLGAIGAVRAIASAAARLVRPVQGAPATRAQLETWATKGACFAAENLVLAASAHGLGSCFMEGFDPKRVARALKLSGRYAIPVVVAVGRVADNAAPASPPWRRPMAEVVVES